MANISKIKALDGITYDIKARNVYDGLDSSSTDDALSANMGKQLNDKITELTGKFKIETVSGTTTSAGSLDLRKSSASVFVISAYSLNGLRCIPWTSSSGNWYITALNVSGNTFVPYGDESISCVICYMTI